MGGGEEFIPLGILHKIKWIDIGSLHHTNFSIGPPQCGVLNQNKRLRYQPSEKSVCFPSLPLLVLVLFVNAHALIIPPLLSIIYICIIIIGYPRARLSTETSRPPSSTVRFKLHVDRGWSYNIIPR